MTTYILKCMSEDNSIYWDSLIDADTYKNEYRGFAVASDRNYYTSAYSWTCSDEKLSNVLEAFNHFDGYADDVEYFMDRCGVKINANRVQFYKALTDSWDDSKNICNVLNLIFGGNWQHGVIRGCCQGDYADVIYNASVISKEEVNYIEAVCFNTGYELGVIEDTDKEPDEIDASDVDYWDYTDKYRDDDIKKQMGLPEAVVLEEHKSTVTVYSYS